MPTSQADRLRAEHTGAIRFNVSAAKQARRSTALVASDPTGLNGAPRSIDAGNALDCAKELAAKHGRPFIVTAAYSYCWIDIARVTPNRSTLL